jgi:hypothetical protein
MFCDFDLCVSVLQGPMMYSKSQKKSTAVLREIRKTRSHYLYKRVPNICDFSYKSKVLFKSSSATRNLNIALFILPIICVIQFIYNLKKHSVG